MSRESQDAQVALQARQQIEYNERLERERKFEHHLGVTGTQRGLTEPQHNQARIILHSARRDGHYRWMHNGDCVGADAELGRIWRELGGVIHLHPPINTDKSAFLEAHVFELPRLYLDRNHAIVDACEYLFAFPGEREEVLRSGTWSTIRYARKVGRKLTIVFPNGSMQFE